jgi:hypothetical protein
MRNFHLEYVLFMAFTAVYVTFFTLCGTWQVESRDVVCKPLNETVCPTVTHCFWDVPSGGHAKEKETCKQTQGLENAVMFGFFVSIALWLALGLHNAPHITSGIVRVWTIAYFLLLIGLTVFSGAYWFVFKSIIAVVFFILLGSVAGSIVFCTTVVKIIAYYDTGYSKLEAHNSESV